MRTFRIYTTVVVAHLNRRKILNPLPGPRTTTAIVTTLFLWSRCVPHTHRYHRYLRTLLAIYINRKIASQLQSCASVLAKLASLVNTMAPDQESSHRIVRGVMQQTPLSI